MSKLDKMHFCRGSRSRIVLLLRTNTNVQQSDKNKRNGDAFYETGFILHSMLCTASTACQAGKEKLAVFCFL